MKKGKAIGLAATIVVALSTIVVLLLGYRAPSQPLNKTLSSVRLQALTTKLCSAEFAGRLTGTEGYSRAARWVAAEYKSWGLRPGFGDSYLQPFAAPYSIIDSTSMTVHLPDGTDGIQRAISLTPLEDFLPLLFSDSGDRQAPLTFVGWGISAPELGYDDYADVVVRDRFVLCFRGTPDLHNRLYWEHDIHRVRMSQARRRGARGLFYVYDKVVANPNGDRLPGFTPAAISTTIADQIFELSGTSSKALRTWLTEHHRPRSFALKGEIRFTIAARHWPDATGYNIVGYLPGSDGQLNNECVVLGAHLDHCGTHAGFTYPGALDNASGSAAVMAIAKTYSEM